MITPKQVAALKYLILNARQGNELAKRIWVHLIDKSEGLTKEVCLCLVEGREGYSADEIHDAAGSVHGMHASKGSTHLHALTVLSGSEMVFSEHYGDFDPEREGNIFDTSGQFPGCVDHVLDPRHAEEGHPLRYTFWLSKEEYSREAELVVASREILESVDLRNSGLYGHC